MRGLSNLHRCPDMSVFAGREFEPGPLSPSPVCALLRVIVIDVLCWVIPELMPDPRWGRRPLARQVSAATIGSQ